MVQGWEGQFVRLVPLDIDRHLENAYRWLNDPEVTHWLGTSEMPLTRIAERAYFERKEDPSEVRFAIETREGKHIGFSGIHRIEWPHGFGMTGSFIGEAGSRGRGFGTDASIVRARYAFNALGLRLLMASTIGENVASMRMLAKSGYEEIGRIPQRFWKRGTYRDEVLFVMSREKWQSTEDAKA